MKAPSLAFLLPLRATMLLLLALVVLGTACATAKPPPGPPELAPDEQSCRSDEDCQMTDYGGECCSCKSEPYAINREALTKKMDICSVAECKCDTGGDCTCPQVSDPAKWRPVCEEHLCKRKKV